jgi:hypothetical protein
MEFIRKNQNSMIIFSVGTAIKPLMKAGIKSDFHIEQERIDTLIKALKDVLPNYEGYFIGANVVKEEVFKMAKNPLMYHREAFSLSDKNLQIKGSSPLVGNAGFAIASLFSDEIYLCGMDLGFRLGEKKHSSGSFYDDFEDIEKEGIKIEGNFSDDIYTNSLFLSSKKNIEGMIELLGLNVYNLSDGAYIKGTIPLKENFSLKKIDKEKIINEMLSGFEYTNLKMPQINLFKVLNPVRKMLDKEVKDTKHLTGLIDFIDNALDTLPKNAEYFLLRGSISHILNNFYILSHKIPASKIPLLQKQLKKDLILFQDYLKKSINSS